MDNKAISAGVEPGGIRDKNQVKILVCYLLRKVEKPLSFDNLNEILAAYGLVNYFELVDAVNSLLETGHIDLSENEGAKRYNCTRLGAGTADLFERSLPFSVREKAVAAAVELLARIKRESENKVEIKTDQNGLCTIHCRILDRQDTLLDVGLEVPTAEQAEMIKKRFLKDPELVYKGVLALLTGDVGMLENLLGMRQKARDSKPPEKNSTL